jgi:DNA replication protein DnaC
MNPINETKENRDGIIQVIQKMKWYSALSKLLLKDLSQQDERFTEIRGELTVNVLNLYTAILKYIIKSICTYYRNPVLETMRKLAKTDDWKGSLGDVTNAENSVRSTSGQYGMIQTNTYLGGIFDLQLSAVQNEIMQKLCVTDMQAEIQSLQNRKDHLLADSYKWIIETPQYKTFLDWHDSNTKNLLWIKGGPGKGKTMLLIGIIEEITNQLDTHFNVPCISYFFCQGADTRLNTATSILRGLIWMLLWQEKSLLCHLEKLFGNLGSKLFEDTNAFENLKQVFQNMLKDNTLKKAYLVVDALDECEISKPGRSELLQLISTISESNNKVKWLVSSRDVLGIERILKENKTKMVLSLESPSISEFLKPAVNSYIEFKMSSYAEGFIVDLREECDNATAKDIRDAFDQAAEDLQQKSDGTFLLVALVCKQIEDTNCGPDKVLELVHNTPPDLSGIYNSMISQVLKETNIYSDECARVLLTVATAYTPLQLSELGVLADLGTLTLRQNIIKICGLLTVREDNVIYFVHQSAKEHLNNDLKVGLLAKVFPSAHIEGHGTILSRSLKVMSTTLKRDIYDLHDPGCDITKAKPSGSDNLVSIRYGCVYWVDHVLISPDEVDLLDTGKIHCFLRVHLLHWLEALSLIKNLPSAINAMKKLEELVSVSIHFLSCENLESVWLTFRENLNRFFESAQLNSGCKSIHSLQ